MLRDVLEINPYSGTNTVWLGHIATRFDTLFIEAELPCLGALLEAWIVSYERPHLG